MQRQLTDCLISDSAMSRLAVLLPSPRYVSEIGLLHPLFVFVGWFQRSTMIVQKLTRQIKIIDLKM